MGCVCLGGLEEWRGVTMSPVKFKKLLWCMSLSLTILMCVVDFKTYLCHLLL